MRRRKLFYGIGAIAVGAAAIMITISSLGVAPKEKPYELVQTTRSPQPANFESFRSIAAQDQGIAAALNARAREADRSKRGEKRFPHRYCRRFYGWTKSIHHVQRAESTHHTADPLVESLDFGGVEASHFRAQSKHAMGSNILMPAKQATMFIRQTSSHPRRIKETPH